MRGQVQTAWRGPRKSRDAEERTDARFLSVFLSEICGLSSRPQRFRFVSSAMELVVLDELQKRLSPRSLGKSAEIAEAFSGDLLRDLNGKIFYPGLVGAVP